MRVGAMMKRIDVESAGLYEISDEELHHLQDTLIEMLKDVAEECEKHGIAWSLAGGNVLGYIRNHGFLPWDDDIDIFMTRGNFEKLKIIFSEKLSNKYEIGSLGDKNYLMQFPKIYKKGTTSQSILSNDKEKNCLYIDIFILENTYNNKFLRTLHGIRCTIYLYIISLLRTERCKENLLKYIKPYEELYKKIKRRLFFAHFFKFRTLEAWLKSSDKCFSKVQNQDSKFVAVPSGTRRYFAETYNREQMCSLEKVNYCGIEAFIMKDYDYYLTKRYGSDYMVPPPEGEEERHAFIKFDLDK